MINKWIHRLIHLNETPYRIAMGCACGIFCSALPIFGQTFIGMIIARVLSASVIASLPWTWISNPLTTLPMWYGGYRLGIWILPSKHKPLSYSEIQALMQNFDQMGWTQGLSLLSTEFWEALQPLWLGTVVMGLAMAVPSFILVYYVARGLLRRRPKITNSSASIHALNLGKPMNTPQSSENKTANFVNFIAGLSLLGIGVYLLLHYALDVGHQVYTLSINTALTSADTSLYQGHQVLSVEGVQIPLLVVLALGGIPLVYQLCVKVIQGEFGADLLAGISIVTAVLLDEYLAGSLVVLMLSGGVALETYAVRKASSVLEALVKRMPSVAHRKSGDALTDITTEQVIIGDTLLILPHEICPVDGSVLEGSGTMDESYLTGEPYMMSKTTGSQVMSGAINGDAALTIRADKLSVDSRYAKIMEVMRSSEQYRPNIRRLGDQLGALYTPIAVIIAGIAWAVSGEVVRFLAVLVVATPCPLLIGIPVTIISSISLAARRNIIIKNPAILETIGRCRTAIFDKTGTLTYGRPSLTAILLGEDQQEQEVLTLIASLERYSKHPLSSAILKAAEKSALSLLGVDNISELPGEGLKGHVKGKLVQITSRKQFLVQHPEANKLLPPIAGGLECMVLIDDAYAATLQFRDEVRSDSSSFIDHLQPKHSFDRVMLVSGDRESEVRYLADLVGIKHVFFSQSPEQKLALVRAETQVAKTLFLGDGINDAPSLTAATIGIAFGQNSDITGEAADAVIMDSSLLKVDELFHIGNRMRKIALQSAVGGMVLSVIGMVRAAIPPKSLSDFSNKVTNKTKFCADADES